MRHARLPRACAIAVLAVLPLLAPAAAAEVEPAGTLPSPRVGASAATASDGMVYVFGGRSGSLYLDEIVRYDPATGESAVVARLPVSLASGTAGRQSAAAVALGSKVYVFGGASLQNAGDLNGDGIDDYVPKSIPDVVEFDPATLEAATLPIDALPAGLWGLSGVGGSGVAHLFGGFTFDISNPTATARHDWVIAFDPAALPGQRVTLREFSLPFPVQDAAAARVGGEAWLFGGLADNNTANPCPLVEGENGTWLPTAVCATAKIVRVALAAGGSEVVAELTERTQFASAVAGSGLVHVLGGRGQDAAASAAITRFSPATREVEPTDLSLPSARYGAGAAVADGVAFLFGGRDNGAHANGMSEILRFAVGPSPPDPAELPDLRVPAFAMELETGARAERCDRFEATLENVGTARSGGFLARFFLDGAAIADVEVASLERGATSVAVARACGLPPGEHGVTVVVDALDEIEELAEGNNEASIEFAVSYAEPFALPRVPL